MPRFYLTDEQDREVQAAFDSDLPPMCDGCGLNRADPPSKLCPGCQAYREHQS